MEVIANIDTVDRGEDREVQGIRYQVMQESPWIHRMRIKDTKHKKGARESEIRAPFGNWMTISLKDIQIIRGIISYIDSKNTVALGLPSNQKYLKDEGKKIEHVHPLCFIWAIVSHPESKDKLRDFRDNSAFALKWSGFLGYSVFHDKGFGKNMDRYYNHREPREYLGEFEAFYHGLGLKSEVMNPLATSKNWGEFASALLEDSSYR